MKLCILMLFLYGLSAYTQEAVPIIQADDPAGLEEWTINKIERIAETSIEDIRAVIAEAEGESFICTEYKASEEIPVSIENYEKMVKKLIEELVFKTTLSIKVLTSLVTFGIGLSNEVNRIDAIDAVKNIEIAALLASTRVEEVASELLASTRVEEAVSAVPIIQADDPAGLEEWTINKIERIAETSIEDIRAVIAEEESFICTEYKADEEIPVSVENYEKVVKKLIEELAFKTTLSIKVLTSLVTFGIGLSNEVNEIIDDATNVIENIETAALLASTRVEEAASAAVRKYQRTETVSAKAANENRWP